jgi:hypothetical protein
MSTNNRHPEGCGISTGSSGASELRRGWDEVFGNVKDDKSDQKYYGKGDPGHRQLRPTVVPSARLND